MMYGEKLKSNRTYRELFMVFCFAILVFTLGQGTCIAAPVEKPLDLSGVWSGNLELSSATLKVIFNISAKTDGSFTATLDVPDQGASKIPVNEVILTDRTLILKVETIRGVYRGTLRTDVQVIEGKWEQRGHTFPLTLKKDPTALRFERPQEPQKPYPYREEEVVFQNRNAGIELAGTLTLPKKDEPAAVVVLISGSGPQDRNETVYNHQPFLIIADYLTRRGLAVLRVDDRGVGGSNGDSLSATSRDCAGDVLASVEYLRTRKEIDPKKIGLAGHSEGALIAGIAAAENQDIAFIVLMAGPGLVGEETLLLQASAISTASGVSEKAIVQNRRIQEKIFKIIIEEQDKAVAKAKIREILLKMMAETTEKLDGPAKEKALKGIEKHVEVQLKQLLSPWLRFFLTFDPGPTLMKITCPILAINGEKDLQVPPKENLAAIERALTESKNPDFTIKELPGLNHLFQTAQTGLQSEYANIEETFAPTVLEIIGDWIIHRTKTR
jgi:hypothetical protein